MTKWLDIYGGIVRLKGIYFVAIDPNKPLSDQGSFDILLQKLPGKEWRQILEDYRLSHLEVTVLDPPDAIQQIRNRQSILQDVADLILSNSYGFIGVPRQLVIKEDASSILMLLLHLDLHRWRPMLLIIHLAKVFTSIPSTEQES